MSLAHHLPTLVLLGRLENNIRQLRNTNILSVKLIFLQEIVVLYHINVIKPFYCHNTSPATAYFFIETDSRPLLLIAFKNFFTRTCTLPSPYSTSSHQDTLTHPREHLTIFHIPTFQDASKMMSRPCCVA